MRHLLAIALLLLTLTGTAGAGVITVCDTGCNQTDIEVAIEATTTVGDTVLVRTLAAGIINRIEAADWKANDVVVRVDDGYTVSWTNTNTGNPAIDGPGTVTGVSIEGFDFTFGAAAFGIELTDVEDFTMKDCTMTGAPNYFISHSGTAISDNITMDNVDITVTGFNGLGPIWVRGYANNWTWTDCDIDASAAEIDANLEVFELAGTSGWSFDNCTFTVGTQTAGDANWMSFEGHASYKNGNVSITNCTFSAPTAPSGGTNVVLMFGKDGLENSPVDSVLVQGNSFIGPNSASMSALKIESPLAALDERADQNRIVGNYFSGWDIAVGVLEGARGVIVMGNDIHGSSSADDVGIYFQDARYSAATRNRVQGADRAIQFADGSSDFENYGNRAYGNYLKNNTYAFYVEAATTDSASVREGNVLEGNTYIATVDNGATQITTESAWNAVTVPSLSSERPGSWNGMGDIFGPSADGWQFVKSSGGGARSRRGPRL